MYLMKPSIDTSKNLWPIPLRSQGICSRLLPVVAPGEQKREQNGDYYWLLGHRQGAGHAITSAASLPPIVGHVVGGTRHSLDSDTIGGDRPRGIENRMLVGNTTHPKCKN